MSSDKLENIYKLLVEHNFDSNKNVQDEFRCEKCRKILIEACQTRCGCRYCRSCVDEMMNNGCQFCPGVRNNCKMESLSTVQLDYRANNQISKLVMRCPREMCSFECELLGMSEHIRICVKKIDECQSYKLSGDMREMVNEKLIGPFELEDSNRNKILIEMIDNIKNEVEELRGKQQKNHQEINKLKKDMQMKDDKIKSINREIETMKTNKSELEKRLENIEKIFNVKIATLKSEHEKEIQSIKTEKKEANEEIQIGLRNIWSKIDEIEFELKRRYENGIIESIKSELIEKIEILQINFNNKIIDEIELVKKKEIKSMNDKIRLKIKATKEEFLKENEILRNNLANEVNAKFNKNNSRIKSINDEIRLEIKEVHKQTFDKSIMQKVIEQKINELEKHVGNRMNGIFEMIIDNVDEWKNKYNNLILSDYFYTRMNPYKLRLRLYMPSSGNELWIRLRNYDDAENKYLPFPIRADVTINVINKNKQKMSKSITKYCQIEKPKNNSFSRSDEFIYAISELIENRILESNCFIIQCCVELKY